MTPCPYCEATYTHKRTTNEHIKKIHPNLPKLPRKPRQTLSDLQKYINRQVSRTKYNRNKRSRPNVKTYADSVLQKKRLQDFKRSARIKLRQEVQREQEIKAANVLKKNMAREAEENRLVRQRIERMCQVHDSDSEDDWNDDW